jgi:hypothetical protein
LGVALVAAMRESQSAAKLFGVMALDLQRLYAAPAAITKGVEMGDQIQRLKDDPKEQQKKEQAEDQDQRENPEQPDVDDDDSGPSQ